MGIEFFFFMVELARFLVDSLFLWKSPWRWTKYWWNKMTCCTSLWKQVFRAWCSWIHLLRYRWIVYSWRRSTVTDGWCKYHTSNDVFSRCKSVHKMATGKSDDELRQPDNKMRIGARSGKITIVGWIWLRDNAWRGHQWQHPWLRGTARCEHQRPLPLTPTWA